MKLDPEALTQEYFVQARVFGDMPWPKWGDGMMSGGCGAASRRRATFCAACNHYAKSCRGGELRSEDLCPAVCLHPIEPNLESHKAQKVADIT